MNEVANGIRRALVHRHTQAGRAFWARVAGAVDGQAPVVAALVEHAGCGPASVEAWLHAAGGPIQAASPITDALTALHVPHQATPRALSQVRELVRGTRRLTLIRAEEPSLA